MRSLELGEKCLTDMLGKGCKFKININYKNKKNPLTAKVLFLNAVLWFGFLERNPLTTKGHKGFSQRSIKDD